MTGGDRVEAIFGGVSCQGDGAKRVFVEISAQPVNASWRDPNVTRHYYEPEVDLQPGDGAAMAWSAVGGVAWNATIQVTASGITVKAGNFTHTVVLTSGPGAPGGAQLAPGTSREWAAARGGFAYMDSAYSGGQLQTGIAQLSAGAGTPAAKLFGESQQGPGIALTGTSLAGARVGFVPTSRPDEADEGVFITQTYGRAFGENFVVCQTPPGENTIGGTLATTGTTLGGVVYDVAGEYAATSSSSTWTFGPGDTGVKFTDARRQP